MIPVPLATMVSRQGERETQEEIRQLHMESNLWRYGKFTVQLNGTQGYLDEISVQVPIAPKDYIKAGMAIHVSLASALPAGVAICNEFTSEGVINFKLTNTLQLPVSWDGTYTFLYQGVIVTAAAEGAPFLPLEGSDTIPTVSPLNTVLWTSETQYNTSGLNTTEQWLAEDVLNFDLINSAFTTIKCSFQGLFTTNTDAENPSSGVFRIYVGGSSGTVVDGTQVAQITRAYSASVWLLQTDYAGFLGSFTHPSSSQLVKLSGQSPSSNLAVRVKAFSVNFVPV